MADWPASLPQSILIDGFDMKAGQQMLRSDMDAGPAKQRRRFSAYFTNINGKILVTTTQLDTLRSFFDLDLQGGSLEFNWVHPISNTAAVMRFVEEYSVTPISGDKFFVMLRLEILPT